MAQAIVDDIRRHILDGFSELEPGSYEPWTEGQDGVDWLDNEIGMFNDIYHIIEPCYQPQNLLENCHCVGEVQDYLQKESTEYLTYLHKFVHLGGTGATNVFEIRSRKDSIEALEFFNSTENSDTIEIPKYFTFIYNQKTD